MNPTVSAGVQFTVLRLDQSFLVSRLVTKEGYAYMYEVTAEVCEKLGVEQNLIYRELAIELRADHCRIQLRD